MSIKLDYCSASDICGDASEVMVYGFQHCRYTQVTEALKEESSPFKKIYDCSIGGPFAPEEVLTTLRGTHISQIAIPGLDRDNVVRELKQYCKAGLTNMVIENIKRLKLGVPLIPVLFVVDIDGNKYRLQSETIASKEHTFVTMGELRRAYKLCADPGLNPSVKKIANATFKFVKTCQKEVDGETSYFLKQIAPFWMNESWEECWGERMEISAIKPRSSKQIEKSNYWRNELNMAHET